MRKEVASRETRIVCPFWLRQDTQEGMGVGPGLCELRRITLLHTPVNRRPTKAYAREQQAGVHNKAGALDRVKNILAASTREDWEAHGSRLWVHKGDTELKIVDLTDDEGRMELKEEWASSAAGAGSVALRVELSICWGSELLAKVPAVLVDSGRAFIPWPCEEEDGRLVVAGWQYELCRVISAGEYLGAHPVRSYLLRAGILVIYLSAFKVTIIYGPEDGICKVMHWHEAPITTCRLSR